MKGLLLLGLAVVFGLAHARVQPEEGLWDDPNAQGRGVTIELQNGVLVATYFGYDENGNAQWWQGVGFENPESTWSGTFNAFRNGQCNGCPFQQAEIDSFNAIGDFSITFESTSQAKLTWDGGVNELKKNHYLFNQPLDFFFGIWTLNGFNYTPTGDYGTVSNAAVLRIDDYITIEGVQYATGNYSGLFDDSTQVLARSLGTVENIGPLDAKGEAIVFSWALNDSFNEYILYEVVINENKMEGLMTVYPVNNPPTNYNNYIRAAGAKYIDLYELEKLLGETKNYKSKEVKENLTHIHQVISGYIRNR